MPNNKYCKSTIKVGTFFSGIGAPEKAFQRLKREGTIKDYKLEYLYKLIGYVPQRAVLFNETVNSNIRYGEAMEEISDKKIVEAARVAQADEFISKMDDGYESHIAQGGTNVSGGQKQRLAIARAIAKNPEIYIIDDTFYALD